MTYLQLIKECPDLEDMMQSPIELSVFCQWIESMQIKSYLEVGLRRGATIAFLQRTFQFEKVCGVELHRLKVKPLQPKIKVCYGDSHGEKTIAWAAALAPFDLVFIDASHEYEDVKADYEIYRKFGKYIAFHDICWEPGGVKDLWKSVVEIHRPLFQVVDPSVGYGIGVISGDLES